MGDALLQLAGRLHPMLLHLPIGGLVALLLVETWGRLRRRAPEQSVRLVLIWLLALTGAVSIASGIVLSDEAGYVADAVNLHRWLGIATGAAMVVAAVLATFGFRRGYAGALLVAAGLIIPTGHFGASMTHGADFLIAPFRAADRPDPVSAPVTPDTWYASRVAPIFESHCTVCHGMTRRKADLALDTADAIIAGGESGSVLGEDGALLRRIHLPRADDDHMPPEGKPQLTPDQIKTLTGWIVAGASFDATAPMYTMPEPDTPSAAPMPPRPAPSSEDIAALRRAQVHVEVIDPEAELLWIDFTAVRALPAEEIIRRLTPLAPFTAELSLRGAPQADEILTRGGLWPNLTRLDLSQTRVGREALERAAEGGRLVELTIIGATLTADAAELLPDLEAIEIMHVWGADLPAPILARLRSRPALEVNEGDAEPPAALEVEPEFIFGAAPMAATLIPMNSTCPVSGTPIDARYSIVYEGRIIAFCCEVCAGKFWNDPASFPIESGSP